MEWISYGDQTWTPKHRDISNIDTLPILDIAKDRLAKIIRGKAQGEIVFRDRGLSYSPIEQYFKRATGGMFPNRYLPYHSLRKSFGMLLVKDYDLHPKRLQEMMRHGDMETTMKFYMSKDMDDLQSALNKKGGKNVVEKNTLARTGDTSKPISHLRLGKYTF